VTYPRSLTLLPDNSFPSLDIAGGSMVLSWSLICAIIAIATSSSFLPMARPTLNFVSISRAVPRQKLPRSGSSGWPLFPFVTYIRPYGIKLHTGQMMVSQQQRLDLFHTTGSFAEPIHNRLFFDSLILWIAARLFLSASMAKHSMTRLKN
jgi:hypothetical protein